MSTEQKPVVQLTITGVKADLENGLDRAAIKAKYNLSHNDMKALFQNPKLKNLKPKKEFVPSFVLVDDEPEIPAPAAASTKTKSKATIKPDAAAFATEKPVAAAPVVEATPVVAAPVVEEEAATEVAEEPVKETKGLW